MEVSLHANMCDQSTWKISGVLHDSFREIGAALSREYGGTIRHLWIDFELIENHGRKRGPWSFRYQKKVGGGRCHLSGLQTPVSENVGHYSVRPNFDTLRSLPLEDVVGYALALIYDSTAVLIEKRKKLGGFDAEAFRADFKMLCEEKGYAL